MESTPKLRNFQLKPPLTKYQAFPSHLDLKRADDSLHHLDALGFHQSGLLEHFFVGQNTAWVTLGVADHVCDGSQGQCLHSGVRRGDDLRHGGRAHFCVQLYGRSSHIVCVAIYGFNTFLVPC